MKRVVFVVLILLASGVAWAAFAPVRFDAREETFEIPKGTYARRMAGDARRLNVKC